MGCHGAGKQQALRDQYQRLLVRCYRCVMVRQTGCSFSCFCHVAAYTALAVLCVLQALDTLLSSSLMDLDCFMCVTSLQAFKVFIVVVTLCLHYKTVSLSVDLDWKTFAFVTRHLFSVFYWGSLLLMELGCIVFFDQIQVIIRTRNVFFAYCHICFQKRTVVNVVFNKARSKMN